MRENEIIIAVVRRFEHVSIRNFIVIYQETRSDFRQGCLKHLSERSGIIPTADGKLTLMGCSIDNKI
jgi:hypothetical protein